MMLFLLFLHPAWPHVYYADDIGCFAEELAMAACSEEILGLYLLYLPCQVTLRGLV